MEYPQILFIKVAGIRNTKLLCGTDGALVCDLVIDGGTTEFQPFDIVLRRPKSSSGIQKNTFIFNLPQPTTKFTLTFKKKYNNRPSQQQHLQQQLLIQQQHLQSLQQQQSSENNESANTTTTTTPASIQNHNNEISLAKVNVSLQYSSLTLNRRSSFNSLLNPPPSPSLSSANSTSGNNSPPVLQQQKSTESLSNLQASPRSLENSSEQNNNESTGSTNTNNNNNNNNEQETKQQITLPININSSQNNISSHQSSPMLGGSPNSMFLSASSSPSEAMLSGSPTFIGYNSNNRFSTVPISASLSISSPTLATNNNEDPETPIRIEPSLRWYKLNLLSSNNSGLTSSGSNNNIAGTTNTTGGMVQSNSYTSFAGLQSNASETESTMSNDEPDIQLQISYEPSNIHNLARIKAYHKDLLDLVVQSKLALVHSICDSIDITASQTLAKSLVDVFHTHHKLLHLLKSFIKKEVSQCHDPGTLFRSNSVAMKMVVAYGLKSAQQYLQQVLTPLVVDLCNSPLSLEVDPVKLSPGEDIELNIKNLKIVSQKFFDRIIQSIDSCPKSIIEICYYFKKIVSRKFPAHWKSAVGGFLFLRLFCPACVSPEGQGIISPGRVGITERRSLILVAKCLQNLSNQVLFNQPYMETINDFIQNNLPTLDDYFLKCASRPTEDQTIDGMYVSEESFHEGIVYLQQFIDKNQEKLFKALETNTGISQSDKPKPEKVMEAVEASKRAVISNSSLATILNRARSNSNGSNSSSGSNKGEQQTQQKKRATTTTDKEPKWAGITKNLKIAKQNVITPALNALQKSNPSSSSSNTAPSSSPSSSNQSPEEEIKILNEEFQWSDKSRPAHTVVSTLLRNISNLLKANKLTDTQSLKMNGQPVNWTVIQQTPEFATFSRECNELQSVYFESMQPDYLTAVFINIFNLMMVHLHFLIGPPNSEVRRKQYFTYRYNVSGAYYSLNDIQHGILRSNPKNSLTRVRQIRGGDKRRAFVITTLDPRIHFALFAVNITIPCMRIFSPETIVEDLHRCGEEFCSSKIDICIKKKEISLPKVFSHYGTDFGKSRSEMLKWIFQFLTSGKRTELLELLEKPSFICLYRSESWNPIIYKTRFINDLDEKLTIEKEVEKKQAEKEKVLRRKSRSLTHGNRSSISSKKDSSANTLIQQLKQSSNKSTKMIHSILNETVKTVSECIDLEFIKRTLDILKKSTKQLSFNDWHKGSSASGSGSSGSANNSSTNTADNGSSGTSNSGSKPTLTKASTHLFSNTQIHCLPPNILTSQFTAPLQEFFAITFTIEKEMNKFLDFMEIASFAQSNDISELLSDTHSEINKEIEQLKSTYDYVTPLKQILKQSLQYFNVSITTKSQPVTLNEENLLVNILQEFGLEDYSNSSSNGGILTNKSSPKSSSPVLSSLSSSASSSPNLTSKRQQQVLLLSEKIVDIEKLIDTSNTLQEINILVSKIKKIGKLLTLYEEQAIGRFSPRSLSTQSSSSSLSTTTSTTTTTTTTTT
ncbi:hypothetical protein DICPUDRAFT_4386, partial [Dictyostelium purpureum]